MTTVSRAQLHPGAHSDEGAYGHEDDAGLRREMGLAGLTLAALGCVIGSGWLLGALEAAEKAGPASIISYGIAGVIMLSLALVYAELGAAYPVTGGISRVPHLAFGPVAGFASGWVAWLGTVTLAPIEVSAALQYLTPKLHAVTLTHEKGGNVVLTSTGFVVAAALLLLFTAINILGIRHLSRSNGVAMIWKLAVPSITIATLLIVGFHASNFHASAAGGFAPHGLQGILTAMPFGVVFSLTGFEQAAQFGGEARRPGRDLPRAIIGALLVGIVLYVLLEVAFVGSISPAALAHGWDNPIPKGQFGPYASIATGLGLGWLATLLYADAVVSPGGTGLVYVGASSRAAYTLARSRYLIPSLAKVDRRGTPAVAILLSFGIGLLMLLPFPGWQSLVQFISGASALMFSFAPLSLASLRRTDPDRERPYCLPASRFLAPASFAAAALLLYWTGWTTLWKLCVAVGIGFVTLGISQATARGSRIPRSDWDLRTFAWLLPYLGGVLLVSRFGQFGGTSDIPFGVDLALIVALALATFAVAVRFAAPVTQLEEHSAAAPAGPGGNPGPS